MAFHTNSQKNLPWASTVEYLATESAMGRHFLILRCCVEPSSLTHKHQIILKNILAAKHASIFIRSITDEEKKVLQPPHLLDSRIFDLFQRFEIATQSFY
jgi:hypothetical protein